MPRLGVLVPTRDRVPAAHRPPAQEPAGDSSAAGSPPCCALLPLPHLMAAAPPGAGSARAPPPLGALLALRARPARSLLVLPRDSGHCFASVFCPTCRLFGSRCVCAVRRGQPLSARLTLCAPRARHRHRGHASRPHAAWLGSWAVSSSLTDAAPVTASTAASVLAALPQVWASAWLGPVLRCTTLGSEGPV